MRKLLLFIVLTVILSGCTNDKNILHIYTWADYIDNSVLEKFEKEYDCQVVIDTFESNEAAYAKLKAGATGYDIMFPSSYQVAQMVQENMVEKLDMGKLPNVIANFDHSFDYQILDPELKYSIPYAVTYTGFMCLADKVDGFKDNMSINRLADLDFRHKITLLDDMREVIGLGLMYNGYSLNSTNTIEIDKAVDTVLEWKKNIRKFDAESYKTEIVNRSIWIGHGYSSDAMQVMFDNGTGKTRDDIIFILPEEGFTIAWDEMVIMKDSKQKDLAYSFINMLFDGEVSYMNMLYINSIMANTVGVKMLPDNIRNMMILSEKQKKAGQVMRGFENNPDIQEYYNRAWDRIH